MTLTKKKLLSLGAYNCDACDCHREKCQCNAGVRRRSGLGGLGRLSSLRGLRSLRGNFLRSGLSLSGRIIRGRTGGDYINAIGLCAGASTVNPLERAGGNVVAVLSHKSNKLCSIDDDVCIVTLNNNVLSSHQIDGIGSRYFIRIIEVSEVGLPRIGGLDTILVAVAILARTRNSVSLDNNLSTINDNSSCKLSAIIVTGGKLGIGAPPAVVHREEMLINRENLRGGTIDVLIISLSCKCANAYRKHHDDCQSN